MAKHTFNEWTLVTLAEMVYALKTATAARFAVERAPEGVTPLEMLDSAAELLKAGPYSDNHGAVDRLIEETKGFLPSCKDETG